MKIQRGFTLIELLITIAIIAILSLSFVPNLLNARRRAHQSVVQGYVRNAINVVETKRELSTGSMQALDGASCVDQVLGFSPAPQYIDSCAISALFNGSEYTISTVLNSTITGYSSLNYNSTTGNFTFLP